VSRLSVASTRPVAGAAGAGLIGGRFAPLGRDASIVAIAAVIALGLGANLGLASSAHALTIGTSQYTITKLGRFHPGRDASLGRAIRAFGKPSSRHSRQGGSACEVRWTKLRLHIKFANYGGLDACSRRGGLAQSVRIARSGKWRTTRNLRVDDSVDQLRHLYPGAIHHGTQWWLKTAVSHIGTTHRYAVLAARTRDKRVIGFTGWIGAAGE
jgi:hypothetical protein